MTLWPRRTHSTRKSRNPRNTRTALTRTRTDPGDPAALLRANPVLLLAGPPADLAVTRLLGEWNPAADLPQVADGVHWAGPFRLDTVGSAQAGLPHGWSTAYAARAVRSRTRVPDGLDADLVRLRYPHGLPTGAERVAWSLVTGLARRLDGAARLPAASSRADRSPAALRARAQENTYCVYGNEALPWSVLRSVLCLSLPELDRNGALADDDYCLDRPGGFEVRVRPFRPGEFVPYALRSRTAADWPGTVYRFRCLPQATEVDAERIDALLRAAACQLADVVGGVLLDGEGFPMVAESLLHR